MSMRLNIFGFSAPYFPRHAEQTSLGLKGKHEVMMCFLITFNVQVINHKQVLIFASYSRTKKEDTLEHRFLVQLPETVFNNLHVTLLTYYSANTLCDPHYSTSFPGPTTVLTIFNLYDIEYSTGYHEPILVLIININYLLSSVLTHYDIK